MHFKAISIGYAVSRTDFNAAVHSVFRSALNLRLDNGGNLLTLVKSNEADLPQGIRVDTPDDFSFEICVAGKRATCRDGILGFPPSALTVDLRGSESFICDLASLHPDMANPSVETAWRFAWQMLNERQIQSNAEIIVQNLFCSGEASRAGVPRKAGEAMQNLFEAAQRCDLTSSVSPARMLIGLGSGLTPSGDDLMVGYLAGLWCSTLNKSERAQFVSNLGEVITSLSHRTNDISRTYLYHAAHGQVSSRLANLAEAICRGENSDLLATAQSAIQIGHTSGMDAVTGLLIGLINWINQETTVEESRVRRNDPLFINGNRK